MQKVASVLPRLLRGIGRRRTANFFETVEGFGKLPNQLLRGRFPLDLLAIRISMVVRACFPMEIGGKRRRRALLEYDFVGDVPAGEPLKAEQA